ncbi:hypothetical protein ASF69_03095 [Rhizobium sp. Leaf311]|jgi:hypothetical protein|uniref:hypothetical protein n=1 Tax=Rhizobium sp. Leaf311 TaxID=1736332 RepID=UPI0007137E15|nr:hypothetical protein [Rhizobium sp. Leaf311]KQQ61396.1 hypothetical protein ASF69_03095 [Rhizobium sp. Leaf311]
MAIEKGAVKAILRRYRDAVNRAAKGTVSYFACNVAGECLPEEYGAERRPAFPYSDLDLYEDIAP